MAVARPSSSGLWRRTALRWCAWTIAATQQYQRRLAVTWQFAAQAPRGVQSSSAQPQPGTLVAEYERFIRQYERQLLNYLWRMTGDEHAAYDLTQEVFLRAWQRFDALRRYEQP